MDLDRKELIESLMPYFNVVEEYHSLIYVNGFILNDCKSFEIPEGVNIIGENCFSEKRELESIYIPDTVLVIEDYAFWECNALKHVRMSNSLHSIGKGVFFATYSLEYIDLPSSLAIISGPFGKCDSVIEFIIRDGIKSIEDGFFNDGKIRRLYLPKSVTVVEAGAFANRSIIDEVYYAGSERDKAKMLIENDTLLNSRWIYDVKR